MNPRAKALLLGCLLLGCLLTGVPPPARAERQLSILFGPQLAALVPMHAPNYSGTAMGGLSFGALVKVRERLRLGFLQHASFAEVPFSDDDGWRTIGRGGSHGYKEGFTYLSVSYFSIGIVPAEHWQIDAGLGFKMLLSVEGWPEIIPSPALELAVARRLWGGSQRHLLVRLGLTITASAAYFGQARLLLVPSASLLWRFDSLTSGPPLAPSATPPTSQGASRPTSRPASRSPRGPLWLLESFR